MKNGFIPENQILILSREELAKTGPVVAKITARAVEPLPGTYAGIIVRLDGPEPHDRTPVDNPTLNPLSSGIPNFDFYSLEVVQRIGYDSFCPDNGVLLAKNKDKESRNGGPNGFNCFNWAIDAHPEDINKVDYFKPDGTPVMRTIADYRQLNDALFHAGLNSGSQFEWEDTPNRLHFYIINPEKSADGILVYEVGIRSLDNRPASAAKININAPSVKKMTTASGNFTFTVKKNPEEKTASVNYDIYRLSIGIEGKGWNAQLLNSIISLKTGEQGKVPVFISHEDIFSRSAIVTLTLKDESDPANIVTSSYKIKGLTARE